MARGIAHFVRIVIDPSRSNVRCAIYVKVHRQGIAIHLIMRYFIIKQCRYKVLMNSLGIIRVN